MASKRAWALRNGDAAIVSALKIIVRARNGIMHSTLGIEVVAGDDHIRYRRLGGDGSTRGSVIERLRGVCAGSTSTKRGVSKALLGGVASLRAGVR